MSLFEKLKNFGLFSSTDTSKEEREAVTLDRQKHADASTVGVHNLDETALGGLQVGGMGAGLVPIEEAELIRKCRAISTESEIDLALQEIRNEVFIFDEPGTKAFDVSFLDNETAPSDKIQKLIVNEFNNIYHIMDFQNRGMNYFNDFYIDGKYYWQLVVDSKNPKAGLKDVVPIDPLDIRKIILQQKTEKDSGFNLAKSRHMFMYAENLSTLNDKYKQMSSYTLGYGDPFLTNPQVFLIDPSAIVYVNSGLYDKTRNTYISHLVKAISHFNKLKMSEDSMLIFRIVRAPQRRAFYVDVGGLPPGRQEAYMKKLMANFKNKMVYDTKTGSLVNQTNIQSMLEDYWLPRTSNGKTTEIQTIDGQSTQDMLEEVLYYRKKLYEALGVPMGRFGENQGNFVFGRENDISREEYRFNRFLSQLRIKFVEGVEQVLKTQLILKKIISESDWEEISKSITWKFNEDNAFVEMKETQALTAKINILSTLEPWIGKYYSHQFVRDKILHQSKEEQDIIDEQNREWNEKNPPPQNPIE